MKHIAGHRASVVTRPLGGRTVERVIYKKRRYVSVQQGGSMIASVHVEDGTRTVLLQKGVEASETVELPSQGITIHLDATGAAVSVVVAPHE